MKPKMFSNRPLPPEVEVYLREHGELNMWTAKESITRDRLLEELADVEGFITTGGRIDAELLNRAPKLKVVSNILVGYNNFDLEAMKKRGVLGTNTPEVLDDTVADLVMGLILCAARRLTELDRYVKEGKWSRGELESLFGIDVHHTTLGIIGMGRIGEAIAKRAKFGFSMDIQYHNRNRKPEVEQTYGAEWKSMEDLLATSDFVVLMTPLTPETEHLIGRKEFAAMKRTAYFINASRGKTVDEQALIEALQQGLIRGAGLDVFDKEPVAADHPLLRMPNVVTLPHIGSATHRTRFDMAMLAARNLVAGLSGDLPPNVVPELKPQQ